MPSSRSRSTRETVLDVDVCAIGSGSGGLCVTSIAAATRMSCVLIERAAMGGDCLNGGCVPSKALLAAGNAAAGVRRAREFGVQATLRGISSAQVYRHVREIVATIAPHDSQETYEGYGATVIREDARFVGPRELVAGPYRVRAKWFFIATGARPAIPPIPGLESAAYLTNETIFELKSLPRHLVIVGAGPIGVEMAQAHRRLGAKVTLIEQATMLPAEDPELVLHLRGVLSAEGVEIVEHATVVGVAAQSNRVAVTMSSGGKPRVVRGSHLLVATGRKTEVAGLGLEHAGVEYSARGITVDRHLRTTNPHVYAVGDVVGAGQSSHLAVHHGCVAFANAVHGADAEVANDAVPRVVYTDPELAQVGLTEREAREAQHEVHALRRSYDMNDRAVTDRVPVGGVKVVVDAAGRILGAGIVGAHAGEVIQTWALAIRAGLDVQAVAGLIAPYPTIGYSNRQVAESFAGPVPLIKYWPRRKSRKPAPQN